MNKQNQQLYQLKNREKIKYELIQYLKKLTLFLFYWLFQNFLQHAINYEFE